MLAGCRPSGYAVGSLLRLVVWVSQLSGRTVEPGLSQAAAAKSKVPPKVPTSIRKVKKSLKMQESAVTLNTWGCIRGFLSFGVVFHADSGLLSQVASARP